MPATDMAGLRKEEGEITSEMERHIHLMKHAIHILRLKKGFLRIMQGGQENFQVIASKYYYLCYHQWKMLNGEETELEAKIKSEGGKLLGFEKTLGNTAIDKNIRNMIRKMEFDMARIEKGFLKLMNNVVAQRELTDPRYIKKLKTPEHVNWVIGRLAQLLAQEDAIMRDELGLFEEEKAEAMAAERMY